MGVRWSFESLDVLGQRAEPLRALQGITEGGVATVAQSSSDTLPAHPVTGVRAGMVVVRGGGVRHAARLAVWPGKQLQVLVRLKSLPGSVPLVGSAQRGNLGGSLVGAVGYVALPPAGLPDLSNPFGRSWPNPRESVLSHLAQVFGAILTGDPLTAPVRLAFIPLEGVNLVPPVRGTFPLRGRGLFALLFRADRRRGAVLPLRPLSGRITPLQFYAVVSPAVGSLRGVPGLLAPRDGTLGVMRHSKLLRKSPVPDLPSACLADLPPTWILASGDRASIFKTSCHNRGPFLCTSSLAQNFSGVRS